MLLCLLGGEPSPGIWKMLRCTICCLCFFGVWHVEDAKMYDLLSLFFGVLHMEDAKMYDLLSLFFWGLAYGRF